MKHTPGPWKLSIAWKIAARRYRIRWLKAVANNQSLFLSVSRRIVELDEQKRINAELLEALEAVGAWMISEDGPLYGLWENGDIGSFENVDLEWEETLQMIHDGQMVGGYGEPQPVVHYRQVLAAKARGES